MEGEKIIIFMDEDTLTEEEIRDMGADEGEEADDSEGI